jgi:DNA-directed RNA polymerase subunit RPC12/RpoP
MELRSPATRRSVYPRPVIACAQCGERILAPDWSEYLDDRKVRHLWACEACGYRFETLARFRQQ